MDEASAPALAPHPARRSLRRSTCRAGVHGRSLRHTPPHAPLRAPTPTQSAGGEVLAAGRHRAGDAQSPPGRAHGPHRGHARTRRRKGAHPPRGTHAHPSSGACTAMRTNLLELERRPFGHWLHEIYALSNTPLCLSPAPRAAAHRDAHRSRAAARRGTLARRAGSDQLGAPGRITTLEPPRRDARETLGHRRLGPGG